MKKKFSKKLAAILIIGQFASLFFSNNHSAWSPKNISKIFEKKISETEEIEQRIKQKSTLIINVIDGAIIISQANQTNNNKIKIIAEKSGTEKELPLTKIQSKFENSKITLKTDKLDENSTVKVSYNIKIPQNVCQIDIKSENGNISIKKTDAKLNIEMQSGELLLESPSNIVRTSLKKGKTICLNPKGPVNIFNETGDILIKESKNSVTAKTIRGKIDMDLNILPKSGYVFLEAIKGNIKVKLPKKIKAHFNGITAHGTLTSEIPITLEAKTTTLSKDFWKRVKMEANGTIGNSQEVAAPITIDVLKGNIQILKK